MSYQRRTSSLRSIARRPGPRTPSLGADMAHGPSWYTAMGGVQSRPVGRRIPRGRLAELGSLGDSSVGADPLSQTTAEWQQSMLDALNRGADTLTLQRWLQIAATLSIPLAAAIWNALWPSLGKRFRKTGTETGTL